MSPELALPPSSARVGLADVLPPGAPDRVAHASLDPSLAEAVLDAIPLAVVVCDADGDPTYGNPAARALRADRLAPARWALARALLSDAPVPEEPLELHDPGRPPRRLGVCAFPLHDPCGALVGAAVTLADVTAQRRLAEWAPVMDSLMDL